MQVIYKCNVSNKPGRHIRGPHMSEAWTMSKHLMIIGPRLNDFVLMRNFYVKYLLNHFTMHFSVLFDKFDWGVNEV